tara:strand:+ start:1847 stop:2083 length:237 start_codon:yes stop_codon:yes gene_type:complete
MSKYIDYYTDISGYKDKQKSLNEYGHEKLTDLLEDTLEELLDTKYIIDVIGKDSYLKDKFADIRLDMIDLITGIIERK